MPSWDRGSLQRPFLVGVAASLLLAHPGAVAASAAAAAAPPTQIQQRPSAEPLQLDAYILGPGDVLELQLLDPSAQALGGSLEILNDGTASLALIGSAQLSGLTLSQATQWLTLLYRRVLLRPELTLRVARLRPMQVSVLGEVQNPGLYSLSPSGEGSAVQGAPTTSPGLPTVVSAIQKAGGITLNADLRQVVLRRRLPGNEAEQKQLDLNLVELVRNGNQRQNPFLFDGDTILIARAATPPPDEVLELGAGNLSPQTITVNVIGEVRSPGRIPLRANTPLMDALLTAGGPDDWRADERGIQLIRVNRNGTVERRTFAVDYSQGVSTEKNPPLREGDTVLVSRSLYGKSVDILNQVILPIGQLLNIYVLYDNINNRF
ncbi:SLBB domain-containing protein [Synechococcus sp. ATX 2A4]|nr:SLBB domain-containing protein [Synechococcus sp. ATX 2A4]